MQFLLEVEELAGLSQRLEPWRRDVYAPLVLEVNHQSRSLNRDSVSATYAFVVWWIISILSSTSHCHNVMWPKMCTW